MSTRSRLRAEPDGERAAPRRRRRPEDLRTEALAVARRLLLEKGPDGITLAAIAAELGTSHTNLLHHFGSAADLRGRLQAALLSDLAVTIADLLKAHAAGERMEQSVVDRVFQACSAGGLGRLMAWTALSGERDVSPQLGAASEDLVGLLRPFMKGEEADVRAREAVWLVFSLAFSESILGGSLPGLRQGGETAPQDFTRWVLRMLSAAPHP